MLWEDLKKSPTLQTMDFLTQNLVDGRESRGKEIYWVAILYLAAINAFKESTSVSVFFIICLFSISLISAYTFFFFLTFSELNLLIFPSVLRWKLKWWIFKLFFWYTCYDSPSKHCFSYIPHFLICCNLIIISLKTFSNFHYDFSFELWVT